jgi:hypothetical protein
MRAWIAVIAATAIAGCAPGAGDDLEETQEALAGEVAAGTIPAGLPARLLVGLFEDHAGTWMSSSGARWDVRYRYFTKGWVNNWGWGAYDGSWGRAYFDETNQLGLIPAVQYYQMHGEPGGGESAFLAKAQNATTMRGYFGDFKILMQRAREYGKPVLILLEADGTGLLQQQSGGNPNAYAAVAATGIAELAGMPNTVAGWGLAFLQLRKAVGANNVILGIHVSGWASGKDLFHFSVGDPLGPEVDRVHAFLAPMGLVANVTGQQYDLLVGDPLDRDADYYRLVQGQDRWWDPSDTAPIASKSFNRYAEWLRLWNRKAAKRWVLWQIPLGNSNHRNVANNGGAAEGYKDNRAEYFFGAGGTAHLTKFADAGVISLLFGAGAGGQSSYHNDTYSDGQLFMRSRAGAFLNGGGLPIAGGGGTACSPVNGSGTGLTGTYFRDVALGAQQLVRTDATVDFDWGSGAPDATLPANNFSVRWTGNVQPRFGGTTTFHTVSDDGVRLWVNGQQLVNNWTDHGPTENSGSIALVAGQSYTITMEYYERGGGATARLLWSSACEPKAAIPRAQLYPAAAPPPADGARYGFESDAQGWTASGAPLAGVASSTDPAFAGARSLRVDVAGSAAGQATALVRAPPAPAGATVTYRVWFPSGSAITAVQPYVLQGAAGGWAWTGNWRAASTLAAGQWNTLTVTVPANAAALDQLGVQLTTGAAWSGAVYVDAVTW